MVRRSVLALFILAGGCAAPPPAASPRVAAASPAPITLATRVRQEGWLTRFWEQLTPAQRRRVLARLRRGAAPVASTVEEAAPVWDGLGLPDRDALVFGRGLPAATLARLTPAEAAEPTPAGPTLAANPAPDDGGGAP